MKNAFHAADILLPVTTIDMSRWAVIACDQHTSEPEYWERVRNYVGDSPSTLNLFLPEVYLEDGDVEERLDHIHQTMKDYLDQGIFRKYDRSMIYIRRTDSSGIIREGLVGAIDLECYDYGAGSKTQVRATEATVPGRLPPRVHIREKAELEIPHIMMLIDDSECGVIEPLAMRKADLEQVYDYELMEGGGHLEGYLLGKEDQERIQLSLESLADQFGVRNPQYAQEPLIYAVGDGNHSLAAAKALYEQLKESDPDRDWSDHPARYALVEVVNLHSPAINFEPIHRIVTDVDPVHLMSEMKRVLDLSQEGDQGAQAFELVSSGLNPGRSRQVIGKPSAKITTGSIQNFLDDYTEEFGGKIDYIHGEEAVENLARQERSVGILLPGMRKEELFPAVVADGALPRKTFSMGHAADKKYYVECRKITL